MLEDGGRLDNESRPRSVFESSRGKRDHGEYRELKYWKSRKIDDGNIRSPNSLMLVVRVKIVNLILTKWEVKQMSVFLGQGGGVRNMPIFFAIHL